MKNSIVIIGTGLAGYSLAKELRKHDKVVKIVLITKDDGTYYSKPMLSTALTQQKTIEQLALFSKEAMEEQLSVEVLTNTVVSSIDKINKKLYLSDGGLSLSFDKLVFAVGASPVQASFMDNKLEKVFQLNNLEDYRKFRSVLEEKPKHIAILGSGLIACEFANDLTNNKHKVSIISKSELPINNLMPIPASNAMKRSLEQLNVDCHWGLEIAELSESEDMAIKLTNNKVIHCDYLLSAIGLKANIQLARQTEIITNRGIVVDIYLQSEPDIYALGDCAEVCGLSLQFISPLMHCARALSQTLIGKRTAVHYPAMPIIVKTPACPTIIFPAPDLPGGYWITESVDKHVKALYFDADDKLRGFAVTGDRVKERMGLSSSLPSLLSA